MTIRTPKWLNICSYLVLQGIIDASKTRTELTYFDAAALAANFSMEDKQVADVQVMLSSMKEVIKDYQLASAQS